MSKRKIKTNNERPSNVIVMCITAAIIAILGCAAATIISSEIAHRPAPVMATVQPVKVASPAELVTKAMSLPEAIVLTPHRDLKTMGIVDFATDQNGFDTPVYLGSPAIAVHTHKGWCVWELGSCGQELSIMQSAAVWPTKATAHGTNIITSCRGYQFAYDELVKCAGPQASDDIKVRP